MSTPAALDRRAVAIEREKLEEGNEGIMSTPTPFTPSSTYACTPGEHTADTDRAAHAARRAAINAGASVSLIAYDPSRGVYAWDVTERES